MNKFVCLTGLPGSGKSTLAQKLAKEENFIIHSSDSLRAELFGDINNTDKNDILFKELHRRIKADLSKGLNVVYDATNLSRKSRMSFLKEISYIRCEKLCYLVCTPYEQCLINNENRDREVPEYVLEKMHKSINIPMKFEGFDDVVLYGLDNYSKGLKKGLDFIDNLKNLKHNNKYHTLTIGEHCKKTVDILSEKSFTNNLIDGVLIMAGLFHDLGKAFTGSFINSKGEETDQCHYYSHENVSAYDSLFYLTNLHKNDILEIVNLIQFHMYLYSIEGNEKAKEKFIKLVGQDFFNKLQILHEADILAH